LPDCLLFDIFDYLPYVHFITELLKMLSKRLIFQQYLFSLEVDLILDRLDKIVNIVLCVNSKLGLE